MFVSKAKYEKDVRWLNQLVEALQGALDQSEKYNDKLTAQLRETIVEAEQLRKQCDILRGASNGNP